MQIQNLSSNYNNTINFKQIKFKYNGLYKNATDKATQSLADTFQSNQKVMDFCNKHNVSVVLFDAKEKFMGAVESSVRILFDNPNKGLFGKIATMLNGGNDMVKISTFQHSYNTQKSLNDSTHFLNSYMVDLADRNNAFFNPNTSGTLTAHVNLKESHLNSKK